jgi:hypothetical protein
MLIISKNKNKRWYLFYIIRDYKYWKHKVVNL